FRKLFLLNGTGMSRLSFVRAPDSRGFPTRGFFREPIAGVFQPRIPPHVATPDSRGFPTPDSEKFID
ncbi:hypothetical protein MYX76_06030, partial [Desulfobacterota bacterium AH_259_B03_O07]|nr:hypothetical protein [Desulfobacterota bacterium AH_259_B03_O07]